MSNYPVGIDNVRKVLISLKYALKGRPEAGGVYMAVNALEGMTPLDAVEVVRCKDCVNRGTSYNCPMRKLVMPVEGPGSYEDCTEDRGFCHMGKRREGGGGNADR